MRLNSRNFIVRSLADMVPKVWIVLVTKILVVGVIIVKIMV